MESRSKLIRHALDTYKIAPLSSWILGGTTGVIIAALLAIDLAVPFVSAVVYPLLILPIVFSAMLQHTIFKTKGQLTFSSSFKSFGLYFTFPFRGSYRFLNSLLKSILVFVISEFVISMITSTILQSTSQSFVNSINSVYELLASERATVDDLNNALMANGQILFKYACIVLIPPYFLSALFLAYNNSRNSLMVYYQITHPGINPRLVRYIYIDTLRTYRFTMLADYMALNWPLYVLLALGFGGGSVLGYFWQHDILAMLSTGLATGGVLLIFFMPFYLCNQEALYDAYAGRLELSSKRVTEFMVASIQQNIEMSVEEKKRLEETLLNKSDEQREPEDNKKDSDEP